MRSLQADLKTFTAHDCYGTSVVVAMTAQNTTGVQAVHSAPPEFIEQQVSDILQPGKLPSPRPLLTSH